MKLFRMKLIFACLIFILIAFISKLGFSQTIGCQRGSYIYIYTQQALGIWYGSPISTSCGLGSSNTIRYAGNIKPLSSPNQSCNIQIVGSGILATYEILNCDIDKYIPFFFLILTFYGFRKTKRDI